MTEFEAEVLLKVEKIKAKSTIAVAVLDNATSTIGLAGISEINRENLIAFIREAQATIDD